jgi:hypothetical protein
MYSSCEYTFLWFVQAFSLLSLTLLPLCPNFQQLSIHIFISSTFIYIIIYFLVDALSFTFSFPPSPKFHRVAPLLKTCSTYESVYGVCFCVYVYLLDLSSTYGKKHVAFVFLSWLLHLTWCSPIATINLQSTWYHFSFWMNTTPLYRETDTDR